MTLPLVNRKKIAVIVNSNNPQSLIDAQWYIQQRGLDPSLILSFAFVDWNGSNFYGGAYMGPYDCFMLRANNVNAPICTTPGYTNLTLVRACAQFYADHGCEAVICSTYTPTQVAPAVTLASLCGNAYYWAQGNSTDTWYVAKKQGGVVLPAIDISNFINIRQEGAGLVVDTFPARILDTWKSDNSPQIPHGRLGISRNGPTGYADYISQTEIMDPANMSRSIMYPCVTDAMAAEQVDHRNDLHFFSTDQTYVDADPTNNSRSYYYALGVSVNAKTINITGGDYSVSQFNSGNVPPFFAYTIISGAGGSDVRASRTTPFIQGSYYLQWTSGGGALAQNAMQKGACAGIGTWQEPLNINCGPTPGDMFKIMYQTGCSMMESNFLSCSNSPVFTFAGFNPTSTTAATGGVRTSGWNTVFGDPLYSPYVKTTSANAIIYPGIGTPVTYPYTYTQGL